MRKLFVVGCSRSGTTLLQQALHRHPRIAAPPETGFFSDLLGRPPAAQRERWERLRHDLGIELPPLAGWLRSGPRAAALFDELARRWAARVGRPDAAWFAEKTPQHLYAVGRIRHHFPEARFVVVHRDGRDVALSLGEMPWAPDDLYVGFAVWLRAVRRQRRLEADPALPLAVVRYESLVARPEEELARLCDFLELEFEPAMASAGAGGAAAGREATAVPEWEMAWKGRALGEIDASRVERWRRELSRRQLERLERWGKGALVALGYELATGGERPLPPWFLPLLWARHGWWRLRRGATLLAREVAGAVR